MVDLSQHGPKYFSSQSRSPAVHVNVICSTYWIHWAFSLSFSISYKFLFRFDKYAFICLTCQVVVTESAMVKKASYYFQFTLIKIVFYVQHVVNKCTISILSHYSLVLLFYTSWKHQKTFRFSDVFRVYKKATPGCNGLISNLQFTLALLSFTHLLIYPEKILIPKFSNP